MTVHRGMMGWCLTAKEKVAHYIRSAWGRIRIERESRRKMPSQTKILRFPSSKGKSILNNDRRCYKCGVTTNLHKHHIFGGANRNRSEYFGCWVYLCAYHHNMSDSGVHFNKRFDKELKEACQERWEWNYGNGDEFRAVFGKSWL